MPRKRRFGLTSLVRYRAKMFRVVSAAVPEDFAREYADKLTEAFNVNWGVYRTLRSIAMETLKELGVPSALRGLYLAFVNELVSKSLIKKVATRDELIGKWTKLGLDGGILNRLADVVAEAYGGETPSPAPKS